MVDLYVRGVIQSQFYTYAWCGKYIVLKEPFSVVPKVV